MKVMEKTKIFGLALSLLVGATLTLVQGCAEEKPTPVKKSQYHALTWSSDAIGAMQGRGGKTDFSAIGSNGTGSKLYFGNKAIVVSANVKKSDGVVSVYDVKEGTVKHVALAAGKKDDSPGNANLQNEGTFVYDAAIVGNIIPGEGEIAVLSVSNLKSGSLIPGVVGGGIAEMDGDVVRAAWRQTQADLNYGKRNVGPNNEENTISALGRTESSWVAFINSTFAGGGSHAKFDAPVGPAKGGPVYGGDQLIVTALGNKGNKLYLATSGQVNWVDGANLATAKIDFTKNMVVKPADLKFDPATDNNNIKAVAEVDGHLIVGMESSDANTGGVILVNLESNKVVLRGGKGFSVRNIAVSRDGKVAVVAVNRGAPLFYANGKLISKGFSTEFPADQAKEGSVSFTNEPEAALFANGTVGAAEDMNGNWNVAVEGRGVYPIKMEMVDVVAKPVSNK